MFGREENIPLLINFLNDILPLKNSIKDISFQRHDQIPTTKEHRSAIFDVYCKTSEGETIIVEMQKARMDYFKERSIYYSTFPIQEQIKKGNLDFEFSAIYTLGILNFVFDEDRKCDKVVTHVQLKDDCDEVFMDKLNYIYVQLPLFDKKLSEIKSKQDKWFYLFKHFHELEDKHPIFEEKYFEKVFEEAKLANYTPEEFNQYLRSMKQHADYEGTINFAQKKGIKKGLEQGKKEGLEEGQVKMLKTIIQNMKSNNFDIEEIAKILSLSADEIKKYY